MEIKNKVSESGLIQLDLNQFKPDENKIISFDISKFLYEELILREKEFRQSIKEYIWSNYKNKYVFVFCSSDAILPTWSYMLVASKLIENKIEFLIGNKDDLLKMLIKSNILTWAKNNKNKLDERYIIKGCSKIPFPEFAMTELMKILQEKSKSILFGEPCSSVPVYKKNKEYLNSI